MLETEVTKQIEAGLAQIETGMKDTSARLKTVEGSIGNLKAIEDTQKKLADDLKKATDELTEHKTLLADVRRAVLAPRLREPRRPGRIGDEAAAALGAELILELDRRGDLEKCSNGSRLNPNAMDRLLKDARAIQQRAALTTSEVPLPVQYYGDLQELIAEYGVARKSLRLWPLSGGTDRPPRMKTRMTFQLIAMSGLFPELSPAFEFCTLSSHKYGGIVLIPRELQEQSIVNIGQWLAALAGPEFARIEDVVAFLADGTATYESRSGICKVLDTSVTQRVTLDAGKTSPSDITAANLRSAMSLVNAGARSKARWYLNQTWEAYLPELNTQANQSTFRYGPANQAWLFGYPIVWTEVLQPYTEDAAAGKYAAVFGDLSWWILGTRPGPRIDTSVDRYFEYDQIAVRFIEELDVDYLALAAAAVIKTAAA